MKAILLIITVVTLLSCGKLDPLPVMPNVPKEKLFFVNGKELSIEGYLTDSATFPASEAEKLFKEAVTGLE